MKLNTTNSFLLVTLATTLISNAATVTLQRVLTTDTGPGVANVSGTFATVHGVALWTTTLTVVNQDLDGDAATDDTFTFDLNATVTSANGVSLWDQGLNRSNSAQTATSFNGLAGLSFTVSNVVGTTTGGLPVVFDGFSGATVGSGRNGAIDRTIDAGGVSFSNVGAATGSFQFLQDNQDFASLFPTLTFTNQGGAGPGTFVARDLDIQFSAIPEPSSAILLGFAGGMLAFRRRK